MPRFHVEFEIEIPNLDDGKTRGTHEWTLETWVKSRLEDPMVIVENVMAIELLADDDESSWYED